VPVLDTTQAHVWLARPEDWEAPEWRNALEALLSPEERAARGRFRFAPDQQLYRVAHAMVRTGLSHYEPQRRPEDWSFVVNAYGRPDVSEGLAPGLSFNLSHTSGLVACAFTRGAPVGVDVEFVDRKSATSDIADRFFAQSEVEALRRLAPNLQRSRFFDYWTLKESYIKARGRGLSLPLGKFAFTLASGQTPTIEIDPSLEDESTAWQFALHSPTPKHRLAVAVGRGRGPDRAVQRFWVAPQTGTAAPTWQPQPES